MLPLPLLFALGADLPHLSAARAGAPIVVDGRLDEAAWSAATASSSFTQKTPHEGEAPTEETIVRVLYDDHALYIGVHCTQRQAPVVAKLSRRDRTVESDRITIALDTRLDGKSALELGVNAAGVLTDAVRYDDTEISQDWDENWTAKVVRTSDGWSAEIEVPLRILRFDDATEHTFGLQVRRTISALQETDEWAFIPRDTSAEVSRYGRLEGLVGLRQQGGLELKPFVLALMARQDPETGALDTGATLHGSAGLDLKWHATQRLTLDATVFPDFGQVEADQIVLNLSSYETFYPEKRPFFVEGADVFATPMSLVYTRRIGHATGAPSLPEDESLLAAPAPAPIFGAEKLVGDLGGGLSVGQIVALTGPATVSARRDGGGDTSRVADPLASYQVLRLKQAIGDRAEVGVLATSTHRLEPEGTYPRVARDSAKQLCPGGEEVAAGARCVHDAYAAGVDGRWRSPSGDYSAAGQVAATLIQGGPPRTFADGTVIGPDDASMAARVEVKKRGGGHFRFSLEAERRGRELDFNDLGYMDRQNIQTAYAEVSYVTHEPFWIAQETSTGVFYYERDSVDWLSLGRGAGVWSDWKFRSFWTLSTGVYYDAPYFDDREIGDGTALERSAKFGGWLDARSDPREPVQVTVYAEPEALTGGYDVVGSAGLTLRVLSELDLEIGAELHHREGETRYVGDGGEAYLFGKLAADSAGLTLRATYTLTPELSLQTYAQAFLAAKRYRDFQVSTARPGSILEVASLAASQSPEESPDYQEGALSANVVLRWEYRLGSTLYFVYSHAQDTSVTPEAGDRRALRFGLLSPRPAADAFVLKLSYWWG